ncbi:hypothetical protein F4776DRAFT_665466 [Hypoxylon sp. NC0597]|nr:hypothetical protein F4776DRAFT_665466 [Hypoxylon sp. NC0597]
MGFWADWSKDHSILNSKITLSSESATYLTAFLAMFVSLAASYLWTLIAYAIHHIRQRLTKGKCRPILRQQQVVFKGGLSANSTALRLIKLLWANRSRPYSFRNSWHLILLSLSCGVASISAGLYSSRIIDTSPQLEVLLDSPNCGFVDRSNTSKPDDVSMAIVQYYLDALDVATTYSRRCYNITSSRYCGPFTESMINWTTNWNAPCPFDESMCIGPAIELQTDVINSNTVLGLNLPPRHQINLEKTTTCAPITQDNYTITVPSNSSTATSVNPIPGDVVVMNLYGISRRRLCTNCTWGVSMYAANSTLTRTMWYVSFPDNPYSQMEYYYNGVLTNSSTFAPIPELKTSVGDATLCFISSNAFFFVEPCDDPVFSTHVPHWDATDNYTYYLGDRVVGVLGCLEKYKWCDPSLNICTPIASLGEAEYHVARDLSPTAMQMATVHMIVLILNQLASIPSLSSEVTQNLEANQKVNGEIQFPLPSNQWQIEVQSWHGIIMKLLQEGILEWALGPTSPILQEHFLRPDSPEQAILCRSQRVKLGAGGGFANISAFSFFFLLITGTLVIVISICLDTLAECLGYFSPAVRRRHRAWIQDDSLHLQRLAYEARVRALEEVHGKGPGYVWIDADKEIPTVQGETLLGPLSEPKVDGGTFKPPPGKRDAIIYDSNLDSERIAE